MAAKATAYRFNLLAPLFSLNVNLKEPPRYIAAERHPKVSEAFMTILGLEDSAQFNEIVSRHESGDIPSTVMWGSCPTLFDSSQAPAGNHTAFMWEKLPYKLCGNAENWDREGETHGQRMLDVWTQFAPRSSRLSSRLLGPDASRYGTNSSEHAVRRFACRRPVGRPNRSRTPVCRRGALSFMCAESLSVRLE